MIIDEYIRDRVDTQISWYDKKSTNCQKKYKTLQIIEIVLASLIPLLSAYTGDCIIISVIVGMFGSAIAIIESVSKLNKYHENWIEYRTTCELLQYQKHLFETNSSPYVSSKEETADNLFVHNIENIISSENNKWKSINLEDISKTKSN